MDNASNSFFIILLLVIFLIVQSCKKLKWFVDNTSFSFFSFTNSWWRGSNPAPTNGHAVASLAVFSIKLGDKESM